MCAQVLMTDKAQGANTDFMLNVLLSECAWGRLEPGPAWVPVGRLATDRFALPTHSGMCLMPSQHMRALDAFSAHAGARMILSGRRM
jgi:hypothetical protein